MPDEDWIVRPLDLLLGYEVGMVMPTVRDTHDTQWHPEDAQPGSRCPAIVARTHSEEANVYWRRKRFVGVQWGKANRRCSKTAADDARMLTARQIARRLINSGRVVMAENLNDTDALRAEDALAYTVSVVLDAQADTKHRLAAASTLLSYTKSKPVMKAETTIKGALEWLSEIEA